MANENEQHPNHFNIFINAKKHSWKNEIINYLQLVDLAFPPPHGEFEVFTIQYSKGPKENPEGTLVTGQEVKVKSGMVFDVTKTDKS